MQKLSRREALRGTGMAALAAGASIVSGGVVAAHVEHHSELAELMSEYREAEVAWGAIYDDKQADRYYAAHVRPMYRVIAGTPARTPKDALAALDYLIEFDLIEMGANGYDILIESLVKSIRGYIAGVRS